MAKHSARFAFRMMGVPIRVRNTGSVPDASCVVVANHASYLDGMILTAVLPANFSFVIKQEVRKVPLAHLLLRRLGSHFVERFNRHRSAMDTRRILKAASAGQALAFFPEGTFEPEPGLRAFRSGAFATAVRAGLPVLPVAIRGSRGILPASAVLPRPGRLEVEILELLDDADYGADNPTIALKRRVRQRILAAIDEPDLTQPA
jgi:1-acyl-sn-glycerol-3-phosphate acyltransferase